MNDGARLIEQGHSDYVSTRMEIVAPKWTRTRRGKKRLSRIREQYAKAMRRQRDRIKSGAEPAYEVFYYYPFEASEKE